MNNTIYLPDSAYQKFREQNPRRAAVSDLMSPLSTQNIPQTIVRPNGMDLREVGQLGLNASGGMVRESSSIDLMGKGFRRWVRMMVEQDATVGAMLFLIEMMVRTVDWTVQTPDHLSKDPQAQQLVEFVNQCLHDMNQPFIEVLSEILSFIPYGWSYFEIVYKQRGGPDEVDGTLRSNHTDNKVGWRKWAPRPQDTLMGWEFDNHGGIRGMWQVAPPEYNPVFIPIQKSLLFRNNSKKGNPEGQSVLSSVRRVLKKKWDYEDLEGIGIERDLAGLPIAWIPPQYLSANATADQLALKNQVDQIVQNVKRDTQEGLVFPLVYDEHGNKLFDFTLLSASGQRQFNIRDTIESLTRQIAMAVMADFMTMGHEKIGSYAMSNDKSRMFSVAMGAWLDLIAAIINTYAIPRLLQQNPGMDVRKAPILVHSDIDQRNLAEIGDYVKKLSDAGAPVFQDTAILEYLLEIAEIPIPEGGLKILDPIKVYNDEQKLKKDELAQKDRQAEASREQAAASREQAAARPQPAASNNRNNSNNLQATESTDG
jgi:hypothetical protein